MKKLLFPIILLFIFNLSLFSQNFSEINEPSVLDITEEDAVSDNKLPADSLDLEEMFIPDDIFQNSYINTNIKTSRSCTVKIFEKIEIIYPGNNWIFEGVTDNTKDIIFISKTESYKDTKFILQAKNAGNKILHFYKKDFIKNQLLDDYVGVLIKEELGNEDTVIKTEPFYNLMPELEDSVFDFESEIEADIIESIILDIQKEAATKKQPEPVQQKKNIQPVEKTSERIEKKQSETFEYPEEKPVERESQAVQQIDTTDILKEAVNLYNRKSYNEALDKIVLYLNFSTKNLDEGYYYKAKILEEAAEIQNIPEALKAYQIILKNYPSSKYWNDANKRAIYLKKFYLEAR